MFFYYLLIATIPFHADPRLGLVLFRGGPLVLTPVKLIGFVAAFAGLLTPRPKEAVKATQSSFLPLFLPFALIPPMATVFSGLPLPTDAISQSMSALLLYLTTRAFVVNRERMIKLVRALVMAFAFGSLWVYKQYFLEHAQQAWGLEGEPNYEALMLLPSVALSLWMARNEESLNWRRVGLLCFALLSGGLVLTKSRAGLIAGFVVGIVAISHGRRKVLRLALLAIVVSLLFALGPEGLSKRFHHIKLSGVAENGDEQSTLLHIELATAGLRMIDAHPFFGIGLNQFEQVAPQYNPEILALGHRSYLAHNTFLQLGAEAGLPVMILFISLILIALRNLRMVTRTADPVLGGIAVALASGLVGISVAACSITVELLPFWLLISVSFSLRDLGVTVSALPHRSMVRNANNWAQPVLPLGSVHAIDTQPARSEGWARAGLKNSYQGS